jgi:hypothetical protein
VECIRPFLSKCPPLFSTENEQYSFHLLFSDGISSLCKRVAKVLASTKLIQNPILHAAVPVYSFTHELQLYTDMYLLDNWARATGKVTLTVEF